MDNPRINQINTATSQTSARNASAGARQNASMAAARRNATTTPPREVGRMSDYGVARGAYQLHEGDVVKGEITDLRNNEITITLEDNTIVKGQISDTSKLSIGQTSSFRLDQISPKGIVIACTQTAYTNAEQIMISKALEEAGLPETDRNQSAVKALIDNLLPINKQAITHLMQQAYDYDTDDMSTLAIMNKQMMTINADTVHQFSNYRNGTHQLLNAIQDFSSKLPALLDTLSSQGANSAISEFGQKLLSIFGDFEAEETGTQNQTINSLDVTIQNEIKEMLSKTPMTEDMEEELNNGTLSLRDALTMIRDSVAEGTLVIPKDISPEDFSAKLHQITQILEPMQNSAETKTEDIVQNYQFLSMEEISEENKVDAANTNTAVTESDVNATEQNQDDHTSPFSQASKFFHNLTENAKNSLENTVKHFTEQSIVSSASLTTENIAPGNSALDVLMQTVEKNNFTNNTINQFLNPEARTALSELLESMSVSETLCDKIVDGTATTKEIFQIIKNVLPLTNPAKTCALFQNSAFQTLFSQEILQSLTITPEKLSKNPDMDSFYNKMELSMNKLEALISNNLSGDDSDQMSKQSHDMQSNIEFMKTLNEAFSYMQLPLRLQNQTAHGDLYVYSKKEKLKQDTSSLNVLLHLDLSHLGTIDVKIAKKESQLTVSFLLDDAQAIDLIQTNTHLLESALAEKGFLSKISVGKKETEENPVKDFLERKVSTSSTSSGKLKRYSFDIRA